jgi:hypothetical protein
MADWTSRSTCRGPADRGNVRSVSGRWRARGRRAGEVVSRAVARDNPATSVVIPAIMAGVEEVEVVVAHHERATLRVGDVFLKIDADQARLDVEVEAMAMAPIPTPEVLWRKPPVIALAAVPGTALGRLGEPSLASSAAWAAAGAAARMLHDAPLPPWPGWSPDEVARTSTANASGSSRTTSFPLTRSRATAGLPRLRSGLGHRCSRTATSRSPTCSSTVTRSPA